MASSKSKKPYFNIFIILLLISFPIIGFLLGKYSFKQSSSPEKANSLPNANFKTIGNKIIDTSPVGKFSYGDENVEKHMYTLYYSYYDEKTRKEQTVPFMKNVSMENSPQYVQSNGERFFFRFVGPGDGHTDYVANIKPPFNIQQYYLPFNFATGIFAEPITWIDEKRILYKQTDYRQNPPQWTYWVTDVNNTSDKKQINL